MIRVASFRDDVVWAIARHNGLDPTKNLLQDEADAIVTYVNEMVRRFYVAKDWPEWTQIVELNVPITNVIPLDGLISPGPPGSGPQLTPIDRVFKVYLCDPRTTPGAMDTPFRRAADGLHVGFEHGPFVWVKLIYQTPRFTYNKWKVDVTYAKGALVYSPTTGNCYKSLLAGNVGNDPAGSTFDPNPGGGNGGGNSQIPVQIIQNATQQSPGLAAQDEILIIAFSTQDNFVWPNVPPAGAIFSITIVDGSGATIGSSSVTADGVVDFSTIVNHSASNLTGSLPGGFVVTPNTGTTPKTITIQHGSMFATTGTFYRDTTGVVHYFIVKAEQAYVAAQVDTAGLNQITKLTIAPAAVIAGAIYTLTLRGQAGIEHTVQYTARSVDAVQQILQGLLDAIQANPDPFWGGVMPVADPVLGTLSLETITPTSTEIIVAPAGSPWWASVDFPLALVECVIYGADAETLREMGQHDKAIGEDQRSLQEEMRRQLINVRQPKDSMTDQTI